MYEEVYALTWYTPEGRPVYWSTRHGWVHDIAKAWLLDDISVEALEYDEDLIGKLPTAKECKEGAMWQRVVITAEVLDDIT